MSIIVAPEERSLPGFSGGLQPHAIIERFQGKAAFLGVPQSAEGYQSLSEAVHCLDVGTKKEVVFPSHSGVG